MFLYNIFKFPEFYTQIAGIKVVIKFKEIS